MTAAIVHHPVIRVWEAVARLQKYRIIIVMSAEKKQHYMITKVRNYAEIVY